MRVLVDTNIFLDDLLDREQFGTEAKALFEAIQSQRIEGYVSATTVTDIFYIVRKQKGLQIAKQAVSDILDGMRVCTFDRSILEAAISSNLPDFEDAVQLACAVFENLDAIITRDTQGFAGATLPMSAGELLQLLAENPKLD
jgi:predicted nucleic acid-binding protein